MCEICKSYPCHPRCPYYKTKAYQYCSICNELIEEDEEYIINDHGEHAHLDCTHYTRDLLDFLCCPVRRMTYD